MGRMTYSRPFSSLPRTNSGCGGSGMELRSSTETVAANLGSATDASGAAYAPKFHPIRSRDVFPLFFRFHRVLIKRGVFRDVFFFFENLSQASGDLFHLSYWRTATPLSPLTGVLGIYSEHVRRHTSGCSGLSRFRQGQVNALKQTSLTARILSLSLSLEIECSENRRAGHERDRVAPHGENRRKGQNHESRRRADTRPERRGVEASLEGPKPKAEPVAKATETTSHAISPPRSIPLSALSPEVNLARRYVLSDRRPKSSEFSLRQGDGSQEDWVADLGHRGRSAPERSGRNLQSGKFRLCAKYLNLRASLV